MARKKIGPPLPAGRGGKAGGGSTGGLTEAPNTLRSKSIARLVDAISEGPIVGLVNGAQSILFNDTKLQNPDGSYNFQGVQWDQRLGLPDQTHLTGFPRSEAERAVGTEVRNGAPIVVTITDGDVDSARVTWRIPQLTLLDTGDGELGGTAVVVALDLQSNGGGYKPALVGYAWRTPASGTATPANSTGIQVVMGQTFPTAPGVPVFEGSSNQYVPRVLSVTLQARYRAVGAGGWTTFAAVTKTLSQAAVFTEGSGESGSAGYWYPEVTLSHTFQATGLPLDAYEYEALQGAVLNWYGFTPGQITISGKTTSPYEVSFIVPLVGDPPWDIRASRVTGNDDNNANVQRKTYFSRYTEIIEQKFTYPNTALIGLAVDSQLFGNSIPKRAYHVKGLIFPVPSNYDPEARTYDGIWDGQFQLAWTNNPAWVLWGVLSNTRWGAGIETAYLSMLKWSLYEIGVYCDGLVDDGFGGEEPRFTINTVLASREEAYNVVQAIASVFRGMTYWDSGSVWAAADMPRDAIALVTNANVADGRFVYQSTPLKTRHTVALVSWNDPADNYRLTVETVEDQDGIRERGWIPIDVTGFGCASRGQAHRLGRWILYSEQAETETVVYRSGLDQMVASGGVRPGKLVQLADRDYVGKPFGGRVAAATTTEVTLDREIVLEAGQTYTLHVTLPNLGLAEREVTNGPGTHTALTFASALATAPLAGSVWAITSSAIAGRLFNAGLVREVEATVYEVNAVVHDPTKYARVEEGLVLAPVQTTGFPTGPLGVPRNLTSQNYLYRVGAAAKSALTFSWEAPADARVLSFESEVMRPGRADWEPWDFDSRVSVDLQDVADGIYQARVRSVSGIGQKSAWAELRDIAVLGLAPPPADVTGFRVNVIGGTAHLSWDQVPDVDLSHYRLKFAPVLTGATWGGATDLLTRVDATSAAVPAMVGTYLVKAVDTTDHESPTAAILATETGVLDGFNAVAQIEEHPAWAGSHDDTVIVDGELRLAQLDTLNDWGLLGGLGPLNYAEDGFVAEGFYSLGGELDIGVLATSRVVARVSAIGLDMLNTIGSWPALGQVGPLNGQAVGRWAVELQQRTSPDALGGSPVWGTWQPLQVGDYLARSYQWRAKLSSDLPNVTPAVAEIEITVDMPDRVAGQEDVTVPAGGLTITFSPAFLEPPAVAVTGQDLATGDYWAVTAKSETGFHLRFFNAGGTGVERVADWIAKGYGYVQ